MGTCWRLQAPDGNANTISDSVCTKGLTPLHEEIYRAIQVFPHCTQQGIKPFGGTASFQRQFNKRKHRTGGDIAIQDWRTWKFVFRPYLGGRSIQAQEAISIVEEAVKDFDARLQQSAHRGGSAERHAMRSAIEAVKASYLSLPNGRRLQLRADAFDIAL